MKHFASKRAPSLVTGFSLIELMIAMVLGLLVIGATFGIFLSNQRAAQASQGLGRMQESSQVAFELMARDIREAGGSPCDTTTTASNIIAAADTTWNLNWNRPLFGYDASGLTGQVAGTDAIQVVRTGDDMHTTTASGSGSFSYTPAGAYTAGDTVMVCDSQVFGIFTAASPSANAVSVSGQCAYLPQPNAGICISSATYTFPPYSTISRMLGVRWFVKDPDANAANGYSLYRQTGAAAAEEVIEGVKNMQIQYLNGAAGYVDAGAVADDVAWSGVSAVRVTLVLQEAEKSGASTNNQPLERTMVQTIAVRSRSL